VYGAAILSSLWELENMLSGKAEIRHLDIEEIITSKEAILYEDISQLYYCAKSLSDARTIVERACTQVIPNNTE